MKSGRPKAQVIELTRMCGNAFAVTRTPGGGVDIRQLRQPERLPRPPQPADVLVLKRGK
ncbi:hypothetical protein [Lysobacter sp. Root667]|uniref:hypothetical protein n=1 Tax=Lysobacter sp. Root667 TaxID=1736581 RepID=UPI000A47F099|nr:hypothetical protein [Lysobacter sp. Root667]